MDIVESQQFYLVQSERTSYLSFVKCSAKPSSIFLFSLKWNFLPSRSSLPGNTDKTRGSHFEIQRSCYDYLARGTREVIISRYDEILDQSGHMHLYNLRINCTNGLYLLLFCSFIYVLMLCLVGSHSQSDSNNKVLLRNRVELRLIVVSQILATVRFLSTSCKLIRKTKGILLLRHTSGTPTITKQKRSQ